MNAFPGVDASGRITSMHARRRSSRCPTLGTVVQLFEELAAVLRRGIEGRVYLKNAGPG